MIDFYKNFYNLSNEKKEYIGLKMNEFNNDFFKVINKYYEFNTKKTNEVKDFFVKNPQPAVKDVYGLFLKNGFEGVDLIMKDLIEINSQIKKNIDYIVLDN
jgi:predicted ATP-grasp superfamily ATP-dependent carboligase